MKMPLKPLKVEEGTTTDELISQIERKDRRFRLAQTIFMVSTFIALIIVIFIQNQTLGGVQDQLSQAKRVAAQQNEQADASRDKIIRRLDCMVVFFTQKDRTNLSIQNIDKCTLDRDGDIERFFTTNESGTTTTTTTPQPEGQATPKAPAP